MTYPTPLDLFFESFVACALWSSTDNARDDGGDPLDANYDATDFDPTCLEGLKADCEAFWAAHGDAIVMAETHRAGAYINAERAGHDFWLTRNGHGAGFWDGDWPEPLASILTDASKVYGEVDLYVGDNGVIYAMGYENTLKGPADETSESND